MGFSLQIFHDTLGAALAAPERAFGQLFNLSTGSVAPTTGMLKLALEASAGAFGVSSRRKCIYSPHSLRATTATLTLDAKVDVRKVQELLGHRHITTTQGYDKRRRSTSESASHDVPI